MERLQKTQRKQGGFTLIELIVVIAILGVLAVVAVPRVMGFNNSAKRTADEANRSTIKMAAEMYIADVGEAEAQGTYSSDGIEGEALKEYFENKTWPENPLGDAYSVVISDGGSVEILPSISENDN